MREAGEVRGHRVLDHTADQILEAWGPTRAACLEEAVAGLVATFAAGLPARGGRTTTVTLTGSATDVLLGALGEVIYLLDTQDLVPIAVHVDDEDVQVVLRMDVVDVSAVDPSGPAPKGVSHSGLDLQLQDGRWTARALIDI
jgi:SHS2 domain-containing protein